jgi:hypothetical protein
LQRSMLLAVSASAISLIRANAAEGSAGRRCGDLTPSPTEALDVAQVCSGCSLSSTVSKGVEAISRNGAFSGGLHRLIRS